MPQPPATGLHWSTASFGDSTDTPAGELSALGEHLQHCQRGNRRLRALRRGLYAVVPPAPLALFTPAALEAAVCGTPDVDIADTLTLANTVTPAIVGKLIVTGKDRRDAIDRMNRALNEFLITGVKTTVSFQQAIMQDPNFRRGVYSTGFVEQLLSGARRELIEEKS